MEFRDYYSTLAVERNSTADDIKRAYRKLARRYHPDVSKEANAETRFKELGEAYAVLKDPEKRAAYDSVGERWRDGQEFQPPPGWDAGFEFRGAPADGADNADNAEHSDFFDALFGHLRAQQAQRTQQTSGAGSAGSAGAGPTGERWEAGFGKQRGSDHHAKIEIAIEDAYLGATRNLGLRAPMLDPEGRVRLNERTVEVRIPKGVREGQHLRLAGQGSPGAGGGPNGDLYLEIAFRAHPRYRISGRDVSIELPVAPWEAALGAQIEVPTPLGSVMLGIPAGSGTGRKLRIKGRGIPASPPGDFHVMLKIVLPPANDDAARAAYREMAQTLAFDPRAGFNA